jgi:CelD/BcsL family acetyltransferase involved in cellulose biosynthesis
MITVDVVNDYPTFVGLEGLWNDTVDRAVIGHPFLRHEWLRTWWDSFGANRQLLLMIVRSGRRVHAIAPLMTERARMYGIPVRRIQFLHNDHTPRADMIVAERPEESYLAIWQSLLRLRAHWDVMQLSQLTGESPTPALISQLAAREGLPVGVWRCDNAPYLELNGGWQGYFNSLTAKLRQNIRNRLTRLTAFGEPALEVIADRDGVRNARRDALSLEASGWKRDQGTAILSDGNVERFYTDLSDRGAASGWLRLLFLKVGGQRIATSYSASYQGRLFMFKTGYDPAYAKCSPFKLLTYFAIQDAFDGGLREVDFLGDAEPWKLEWTASTRPHDWLFVFGRTSRGRLTHAAKFRALPALKRWLRPLDRSRAALARPEVDSH